MTAAVMLWHFGDRAAVGFDILASTDALVAKEVLEIVEHWFRIAHITTGGVVSIEQFLQVHDVEITHHACVTQPYSIPDKGHRRSNIKLFPSVNTTNFATETWTSELEARSISAKSIQNVFSTLQNPLNRMKFNGSYRAWNFPALSSWGCPPLLSQPSSLNQHPASQGTSLHVNLIPDRMSPKRRNKRKKLQK